MSILILNQHQFTDNHGYLISGVIERLISKGYNVDYICYKTSIKKENLTHLRVKKVNIRRIEVFSPKSYSTTLRIIDMIYFSLSCFFISIFNKKNYETIIVSSSHVMFLGLTGLILSKIYNAKFIYRIEDLTIEGNYLTRPYLKFFLFPYYYIDKLVCLYADQILTLSDDMVNSINSRFVDPLKNISKIPNLPKISKRKDFKKKNIKKSLVKNSSFRIVFIGNIGLPQGLDFLINVMKKLKNNKIELFFVGDGYAKKQLIRMSYALLNKKIHFIPFQEDKNLNQILNTSDLGVISLIPGFEKFSFPSKIYSYLEMNCPILGIVNKNSEISKLIKNEKIGISVEYGDHKKLERILVKCSSEKKFKDKYVKNIKLFRKKYFSKNKILNQWVEAIEKTNIKK